jgi:hypothetical protein
VPVSAAAGAARFKKSWCELDWRIFFSIFMRDLYSSYSSSKLGKFWFETTFRFFSSASSWFWNS